MRKSRIAVVLALVLVCMTAGALIADQLADAKKLIADGQLQLIKDFDINHKLILDPGKLACYKTYNDAVTAAKNAFQACVNNPAPNSPLGQFNAKTNAQLATFCGNKTLAACVAGVMSQQRDYCNNQTDYIEHLNAAKKAEEHCLSCDTLHDKLVALENEFIKAGCGRRLILER